MRATIAVRPRRLLFLAVVVGLATVLLPSPAAAHTVLVRSDPAGGAVLAESPGLARLWFSEDMTASRSTVRLVDGAGRGVSGAEVARSDDRRVLAIVVPPLRPGTYGLLWEAVSAADGHRTNGTIVFSVGTGFVAASHIGSGRSGDLFVRWIGLAALAGVIGALAVGLLVVRRFAVHRRRLMTVALGSAVVALVVSFLDWRGALWIVHVVALVGLCLLSWHLRRTDRVSVAVGAGVVVSLGLLMWVEALGSHAAAVSSGRLAALLAAAVHATAGLLWLGAIAALLVVLWPRGRTRTELVSLVRAVRGPFSVLAAGSVLLVVVTGLYGAGVEVATTSDLTASSYGRLLVAKSTLLVVMGLLGLANARWLRQRSLPGRTILAEAATGLVLLVAVGILVVTPPPRGSTQAASDVAPGLADSGPALTRSGMVEDLVVTASATPNRPGVNWFTVLAESSRRPAPAPIEQVDLVLGTKTVPLQRLTETRYFATYQADSSGPLRVVAVVHRAGRQYAVPLSWQVAPAESPVTSGRRLAPYVDGAALLVIEAAIAAAAWWLVRTTRRRPVLPVAAVDRSRGGPR